MHLWFLHGQRNELLHRDIQCGGQLHECTGTASGKRCLAGANVRQRCPRHTAFLGELVAGEVLFPAVSVGSSYTSPFLLYRCADNQSRENLSLLADLFICICLPKTVDYYDTDSGTSLYGPVPLFFCLDFESIFRIFHLMIPILLPFS